jgi:hypothetical protein
VPEWQGPQHGAPIHDLEKAIAQHHLERDRRQKPHELAHDVQRYRNTNIEQ